MKRVNVVWDKQPYDVFTSVGRHEKCQRPKPQALLLYSLIDLLHFFSSWGIMEGFNPSSGPQKFVFSNLFPKLGSTYK